jgi:hypothetical protein
MLHTPVSGASSLAGQTPQRTLLTDGNTALQPRFIATPAPDTGSALYDVHLVSAAERKSLAAKWLGGWWLELVASFLAVAGVLAGVLTGFHPREWQASGSDLKTLYAAAQCFRQHLDPYSFATIAKVFHQNAVVLPTSWYAHAPVYPPFTLAAIAPLTAVPMVQAVYLWIAICGVLLALAAFTLTRAASEMFLLGRTWRFALIALFAASPLLSFGLEMCNVSPVVAALCIIAVARRDRGAGFLTLNAAALCLGLLLKPHLAIWVVAALLLSRIRADRSLALRGLALFAGAMLATAGWLAIHHQLLPEIASYRNMVGLEMSGGSMGATNYELIAVAAQITWVASLLGYWLRGSQLHVASMLTLLLLGGAMLAASWQDAGNRGSTRLLRIASWSALGLVFTYHRAHDGAFLLVLLPYVIARLCNRWRDPFAWAFLALYAAMGLGPRWETMWWLATRPGFIHLAPFLLYRQSAFAAVLLVALLIAETMRSARQQQLSLVSTKPRRAEISLA